MTCFWWKQGDLEQHCSDVYSLTCTANFNYNIAWFTGNLLNQLILELPVNADFVYTQQHMDFFHISYLPKYNKRSKSALLCLHLIY